MTGIEYKRLCEGSPHKARRALFDEYCAYVYAVAFNRLRSVAAREDTEECVSDVFADVYRRLDGSDEFSGELKPLIATIAKRRAIDHYRKATAKKLPSVSLYEDDIEAIASGKSLEEETEKAELREILLKCIDALGEPDATIIVRKFYYDRTSKEIADELSMTATAVRTRCRRALKKIREELHSAGIAL